MVVDEGISPSLATPIVEPPRKERPKKTKKEAPPRKPPSPIRVSYPKVFFVAKFYNWIHADTCSFFNKSYFIIYIIFFNKSYFPQCCFFQNTCTSSVRFKGWMKLVSVNLIWTYFYCNIKQFGLVQKLRSPSPYRIHHCFGRMYFNHFVSRSCDPLKTQGFDMYLRQWQCLLVKCMTIHVKITFVLAYCGFFYPWELDIELKIIRVILQCIICLISLLKEFYFHY